MNHSTSEPLNDSLQRSEERVRRSDERFRVLLEQAADGIFITDGDGRCVDVNGAGCRMLASAREEVVGKTFDDLVDPMTLDRLRRLRAELLRGESFLMEWSLLRSDGTTLPVEINVKILSDGGWQIFVRDISERRRTEADLSRAVAEIDVLSRAERTDRVRMHEEWVSIVAHDLRQPVAAIRMSTSLLLQQHDALPPRHKTALERVRASTEKLNRMIDDLVDISSIEANRLTVSPGDVDLRQIADNVAAVIASSNGAPVVVRGAPSARAWVDGDRIEQVLMNLVTNAVKYGEPEVDVLIEVTPRNEDVVVAVKNQGPGIDADDLPHVFSRFTRAKNGNTKGVKGLGLGLYIARALVEANGGRIWAESIPGETTTFSFSVPVSRPAE